MPKPKPKEENTSTGKKIFNMIEYFRSRRDAKDKKEKKKK